MNYEDKLKTLTAIQNLPYGDQFTANGLAVLCSIVAEIVTELKNIQESEVQND